MTSTHSLSLAHTVRPAAETGAKPPLLILLHGIGANERQMTPLMPLVDPRYTVVCARSPLRLGPDAYAWFHAILAPEGAVIDAAEAEAGWKLASRFAGEAVEAYEADPKRVFIGGFSQGGIIGLATLLTAPHSVAGAVVLSGRLLPEVVPHIAPPSRFEGKAVLMVHGDKDETIRIDRARWSRSKLAELPIDLAYLELAIRHTMPPDVVAELTRWLVARLDEG